MLKNLDRRILTIIMAGIVVIVLISALLLLFKFYSQDTVKIYLGSGVVGAKVAASDAERQKGLSGTKELKSDQGLLMVFDTPAKWSIWMKNMHYNIDVIWLDENRHVVDITTNLSPDTYPQAFSPKKDAKYILELPAGYVDSHGISEYSIAGFQNWQF